MKILYSKYFIDVYNYEINNIWSKKLEFNAYNPEIFNNCDYLVVFNKLREDKIKTNGKTILIIWEPPSIRLYSKSYLDQFNYIISNFNITKHINSKYLYPIFIEKPLKELNFESKIDRICIFNTLKYHPTHTLFRSILFEKLEKDGLADLYGKNTQNGIANKGEKLQKYKYTVIVENFKNKNYFSEKLIDAILCENLIFYDGATDIFNDEFICKKAIIFIDVNNFDKSIKIIKNAILNDEYSKRVKFIKESKKNILSNKNSINNIISKILIEDKNIKKKNKIIYSDKKYLIEKCYLKIKFNFISNFLNIFYIFLHFVKNFNYYRIKHLKEIIHYYLLSLIAFYFFLNLSVFLCK